VRQDITGRHYDQYVRAREKRIALNAWSAALARILELSQAADAVLLKKGRS